MYVLNNKGILFSVQEILAEIYSDNLEEAIIKLNLYDLKNVVDNKLQYLKSRIEKNEMIDLNIFSVSLLKSINDIVLNIEDDNDRKLLKYILSDIGTYLIDSFIKHEELNRMQLTALFNSLRGVSEIEGYDFKDLEMRLQLQRSIRNQLRETNEPKESNLVVFYEWLGEDHKLIELAENLKSEKSISSVKDFKKLFTAEPRKVTFSENSKKFIVVLFDLLYEKKLIKPRKNKGHLLPLKRYAVNLENNFLFKNEMKVEKQMAKKNPSKYHMLRTKAKKWIS